MVISATRRRVRAPAESRCMTFFVAFAVLLLAAATLLVFAGREFLRVNGFPRHRRARTSATWSTWRRWATQPSTRRRTEAARRRMTPVTERLGSAAAAVAAERRGAVPAALRSRSRSHGCRHASDHPADASATRPCDRPEPWPPRPPLRRRPPPPPPRDWLRSWAGRSSLRPPATSTRSPGASCASTGWLGPEIFVVVGEILAARVRSRTSLTCWSVISVTTVPAAPARAVRPERCR